MAVASDIVARALAYLRVNEVGEQPTSDEVASAGTLLPGLAQEWTTNRVVDIDVTSTAIPDKYVAPAARLPANRVAAEFGRPSDPDLDLREQQRLRNLQSKYSRRRGIGGVEI